MKRARWLTVGWKSSSCGNWQGRASKQVETQQCSQECAGQDVELCVEARRQSWKETRAKDSIHYYIVLHWCCFSRIGVHIGPSVNLPESEGGVGHYQKPFTSWYAKMTSGSRRDHSWKDDQWAAEMPENQGGANMQENQRRCRECKAARRCLQYEAMQR